MDNQQLCNLTENQKQVFLSGVLGDGSITTTNSNSTYYKTNCKYEEYIDYKIKLLGNMFKKKGYVKKNGYSQNPIWEMRSCSSDTLLKIKNLDINLILDNLNELGLALWFYDDGSLHKNNLFYNLNTHAFTKEIQEKIFIPYFNNLNIYPILRKECKKDGRIFYYLCINKFAGASEISKILSKYPIKCYSYKLWSSETILKWSKLQEKLKSEALNIKNLPRRTLGKMLKDI